ncbi:MAG: hypothetical protein P8X42_09965 [Calditrichaceae bacterium]
MKYKNLGEMFFSKRENYPDKTGYMFKEKGTWKEVSFKEVVNRLCQYGVRRLVSAYLSIPHAGPGFVYFE